MQKVAIVTGGSRGIGLGISEALAAEGWTLMVCGLRPAAHVAGVLKGLRARGRRVEYCRADIGSRTDRLRLMKGVRQKFGRLDLLVNNAGVAPLRRDDLLDATEASFERVMRTNLQEPYFLTQLAARWMIAQRRAGKDCAGVIINISSVSATMSSPSRGEYCLSKAAVSMATRLWAVRLAEYGINVYEIRPGIVATDMTAGVRTKYDKLIADGLVPQGRWGLPSDVGRAAAMLARGDLPYSTGQVLMVDGGMTIQRL